MPPLRGESHNFEAEMQCYYRTNTLIGDNIGLLATSDYCISRGIWRILLNGNISCVVWPSMHIEYENVFWGIYMIYLSIPAL